MNFIMRSNLFLQVQDIQHQQVHTYLLRNILRISFQFSNINLTHICMYVRLNICIYLSIFVFEYAKKFVNNLDELLPTIALYVFFV